MALTLSTYDALLKDLYEGGVREQLNNDVPCLKHFEETDRAWSGRRVVWPVHTGRNSGVGSRGEGATLPTAGEQAHSLSIVTATYFYARGQVSGQTIAAGKNAFVEALSSEMDGLMMDAKVEMSRQLWGTGDGRLAQVAADALCSTSITVYNRYAEPQQPGARFISANQLIDGGSVASPTQDFSSQTVISVSISQNPATTTDTITVSNSALPAISQCDTYIFNRGAGGAGVESLGIQALVDVYTESNMWGSNAFYGTTIQGIARNTVTAWNALVLGNSGVTRLVDSNLMQTSFDRIHTESGEDADLIFGQHDVVRAFLDSVAGDRRYQTTKFDAGVSSLSYNGVPIERDRQAPYNCLLVAKRSALRKFTLKPIGFADNDGSILSRVSNQDNWEFFLSTYFNLGVDGNMKSLLFIRDIKVDL